MSALHVYQLPGASLASRTVALIGDHLTAGATTADVVVLARVNSALLPVQVALTEAGIRHTAPLDSSVLGRTGVRTALAYLRLGLDLERIAREDLVDTINRPARKVKSAVLPLLDRARRRGGRLSIRQLEQLSDALDPTHQQRFRDYLGDLRALEGAITDGADTAACLQLIRERIGLGEAMDALDSSRTRPEGSSHGDDLDALEQLAALCSDPAAFRTWLTDCLRVPGDPDGVTLSTVHRVKGLEWPHVLVHAANDGLFPHRLADDVEEERRVFHVAVTRCVTSVAVLADAARPSPFLAELTEAAPADAAGQDAAGSTGARTTGRPDAAAPVPVSVGADRRVVLQVGQHLTLPGGLDGTVDAIDTDSARVVLDVAGRPTRLRLPPGAPILIDGSPVPTALRPPPRPATTRSGGTGDGATGIRGGRRPDALELALDEVEVDEELYESLRAWRTRTAQATGLPAYLILQDRTLQVIAGRKPTSLVELARCPGIGPAKLDRFGDDLLDVVDAHAR